MTTTYCTCYSLAPNPSALAVGTRQTGDTGDEGNPASSQLFRIDGSDQMLLTLIQVRKQQGVFLLELFGCAHTHSIPPSLAFVTATYLRALTGLGFVLHH